MAVGADLSGDASQLSPEEQERRAKIMYNQRARPVPAA
jgi:GSH-dependent disulfide-bond oxidoreductase